MYILGSATSPASGIFTRCIFKFNTAKVREEQLLKIFHSRFFNFFVVFFLHIKNHKSRSSNHRQKI